MRNQWGPLVQVPPEDLKLASGTKEPDQRERDRTRQLTASIGHWKCLVSKLRAGSSRGAQADASPQHSHRAHRARVARWRLLATARVPHHSPALVAIRQRRGGHRPVSHHSSALAAIRQGRRGNQPYCGPHLGHAVSAWRPVASSGVARSPAPHMTHRSGWYEANTTAPCYTWLVPRRPRGRRRTRSTRWRCG